MGNPLFNSLMMGRPGAAAQNPVGYMQGVMDRARQIASAVQSPEQLVRQFVPDAPAEMARSPEQIIGWLQQTGRVSPQAVQMARQLMGK